MLSRERDVTIVLSFLSATDEELLSLRDQTIDLTTVDIRGDKVRTGVKAPDFVSIDREEVHRAKAIDAADKKFLAATEAAIKR